MILDQKLEKFYQTLLAHYGPQNWWPGDTPFEVMVGAILTQNTNWANVEKTISNLKAAQCLDAHTLDALSAVQVAELIRPAGYYRLKARRLRNLLKFVVRRCDGAVEDMFRTGASTLREELLAVNGIGPETADSILLYGGGLPEFVVDAYTYRAFSRHGWIDLDADYHTIKDHFESHLKRDASLYNEYHALLVRLGHLHCRKTPKCEGCPLADLLPEDGPL